MHVIQSEIEFTIFNRELFIRKTITFIFTKDDNNIIIKSKNIIHDCKFHAVMILHSSKRKELPKLVYTSHIWKLHTK